MNKIVKIALIASTVMAAALAGVMIYLNQLKSQNMEENELKTYQELDILTDEVPKTEFTEDDVIIPLYLSGKKKNVLTFKDKPLSAIYTTKHTKNVNKKLHTEQKRGSRRIDNAVWAWNPYGTQPMSLYIYFPTREPCTLEYTITTKDETIPDFSRTLNCHEPENVTETQEYSIVGLIPGKKNYITLRLYDADGKKKKEVIYSITPPDTPNDIEKRLTLTKGYNQLLLSNGLYAVYGNNHNNNANPYILFYDNSGYLRNYIPLKNFRADQVEEFDGCLFFACSDREFALMSPTGQIKKMYKLDGYRMYAGFAYDGKSNVYILADNQSNKQTKHDGLISLNLKNGDIEREYDLSAYLGRTKQKAKQGVKEQNKLIKKQNKKNKKKKKQTPQKLVTGKLNWLDLNSIQYMDSSNLILSSRELSSVIILKKINKKKPVLKSIIGESIFWQRTGVGKKVADKSGSFNAHFGQSTVTWGYSGEYENLTPEYDDNGEEIEEDESVAELAKQYYIYMFNSNYGNARTVPSVNYASYGAATGNKQSPNAYFIKYLYDETKNVYRLDERIELPFSADYGSVQVLPGGNVVAGSTNAKVFMEYTPDGKMLHSYKTGYRFTKVEKETLKDFWFD